MNNKSKIILSLSITAIVLVIFLDVNDQAPLEQADIANVQKPVERKISQVADDEENIEKPIENHKDSHIHKDERVAKDYSLESIPEPQDLFSDSDNGESLKYIFTNLDSYELENEVTEKINELDKKEAVSELKNAFQGLGDHDYDSKYNLIYIAEEMNSLEAKSFFKEVLDSPISRDLPKYQGDGSKDYMEGEIMLKMRALGALSSLASQDPSIRDEIFNIITPTTSNVLLSDAVSLYLKSSTSLEADKEKVKQNLDPKDYYLVDLQESDPLDFKFEE